MSTLDLVNVKLRCHLSTNMTISDDWESRPSDLQHLAEDADWRGDLEWKVPNDVLPGEYYVGVMVTFGATPPRTRSGNTTFFPETLVVEAADPPTGHHSIVRLNFMGRFFANSASGSNSSAIRMSGGRFGSQFFEVQAQSGKLIVNPYIPGNAEDSASSRFSRDRARTGERSSSRTHPDLLRHQESSPAVGSIRRRTT